MKRLTFSKEFKDSEQIGEVKYISPELAKQLYDRLAEYEDTGLSPERCAELAKAEQEGRLHISPVPLGGKIYCAYKENAAGNYEVRTGPETVTGLVIKDDGWYAVTFDDDVSKIGSQYAALSAEEAEKALESEGG